jgi:putative nucleotidyltransferase with HDIG domain
MAYDATIEGWSRALELRDKQTEGHSFRVTDITLELARILGLEGDELVHIRRGALLHDIGKIGIPDAILHKPSELTSSERKLLEMHPLFSYDMLKSINFLHPAIDIPYCHHEKWDGSGYPRGLKGKEIPLPVRIFSIVNVYDKLISDRPYRPAWSRDKALEYIREKSGKHFDPEIVKVFLNWIEN